MAADEKLARLAEWMRKWDKLLVAFSGGVDSSLVLKVASTELPGRVVALTIHSPTMPAADVRRATQLAESLGVEHVVVEADELAIPNYAANPVNRCYFCKDHLYRICLSEAESRGVTAIADGVNADDLSDYRPGLKAAQEHGVYHPLADVGLHKEEIRVLSQRLELPAWDRPASPCLSSRFPYGTRITHQALAQVAGGEEILHREGFRECRVRYHEQVARIEVPVADLERLLAPDVRRRVVDEFKRLGFRFVALDLQGFRSGSLNEGIADAAQATSSDITTRNECKTAATPPTRSLPAK